MHLNKILEQIKRHQSPTEALDISNYQIIYKSIKL